MAHITVKKSPGTITGEFAVSHETTLVVAQSLAQGCDIELVAALVNKAYHYGEIPGVPNPRVAPDGFVIDSERMRAYSIGEVAAIAALPETVILVKALQEQRAREEKEERREARVEQLTLARAIKAAKHDRSAVPALYAEVVELRRLVEWLVDGMDRQMGVMPLKQKPQWTLPELPD